MGKSSKRNWIIAICLVFVFSFFFGYYLSFRINEKEKTKIEIIKEIMENEWYYGIDDEDISTTLETKMILAMQDLQKDPHTQYLTSLGSLADSYRGIGVSVNRYGEYYIISEVSSKTSIDAGVKVNDILVYINGESVRNKTLKDISTMVSKRDDVTLGIIRGGQEIKDENIITINTFVTSYNPITVFTKEYNDEVAYVKITEFNNDTASNVEKYFSTLDSRYNDLIIDLRGNPGGYISSVQQVFDLFVSANKTVLTTVDKKGNSSVVKTMDDGAYLFDEIYVLINGNSASGAEALAAALDYHLDNVVLYGDTTYGKGSAQKTYYFEDGTYFHYTYALWKTPFNETINKVGVKPHVEDINTSIANVVLYDENSQLYDYSDNVKSIQTILSKLGYYTGEIHSFMDENTVEALKDFQVHYGISQTGIFDENTKGIFAKLIYDDSITFLDAQLERVLALFS